LHSNIAGPFKGKLSGITYMCIASLFFAAVELLGGLIPPNYSPLQTVWTRYAVHIIFMLAIFGPRYRTDLVRTKLIRLQLFRPTFMIGMPIFFLLGIKAMPPENVWSIFWLSPLMIMAMSLILTDERGALRYWIATIGGFIGICAIFQPTISLSLKPSIIWPLGMAFCFSCYVLLTKNLHTEHTVTNVFYSALVVFLPWSLGLPYFWQRPTFYALIMMSAVGILGFCSLYFLDKAQQRAPMPLLAAFLYAEPVSLVVLTSTFQEHASLDMITLGGILLVVSIGLILILIEASIMKEFVAD